MRLAACLDSLTNLDYPRDLFEVIVVDDGSKTPLKNVVTPFRDELNLLLLTQPNAGPASARNAGAMEANGAFLAFTDDDCTPAPNWLKKFALRLAEIPDHMLEGRVINAVRADIFSVSSQLMMDAAYAYNNGRRPHFFASNNLVVPADRFRALGGFDTSFPIAASQDREFCERWLQQGYQMTYAPEAVVEHAHALTFRNFLRHHFNYGRGAFHFHSVRARRGWQRLTIDPRFYLHLFRYPFSHVQGTRAFWFEAMFMLSYIAYTSGFFWEKVNRAILDRGPSSDNSEAVQ
jgi:glycosyltransferase involved in cell wall biosynthesis